eukprot:11479907-Alexandrium_andersonii.AAC.1
MHTMAVFRNPDFYGPAHFVTTRPTSLSPCFHSGKLGVPSAAASDLWIRGLFIPPWSTMRGLRFQRRNLDAVLASPELIVRTPASHVPPARARALH